MHWNSNQNKEDQRGYKNNYHSHQRDKETIKELKAQASMMSIHLSSLT